MILIDYSSQLWLVISFVTNEVLELPLVTTIRLKCSGMAISELNRILALEIENRYLNLVVTEQSLDVHS